MTLRWEDLDEAEHELAEERAAIAEHDGGLPRAEAEKLALEEAERRRGDRP